MFVYFEAFIFLSYMKNNKKIEPYVRTIRFYHPDTKRKLETAARIKGFEHVGGYITYTTMYDTQKRIHRTRKSSAEQQNKGISNQDRIY